MDSSTPRKETKGLGRLWTKLKLAITPKSKRKTMARTSEISNSQPPRPSVSRRYSQEVISAEAKTNTSNTQQIQPDTLLTQLPVAPAPAIAADTQLPASTTMQAGYIDPAPHIEVDEAVEEKTTQPTVETTASPGGKEELAKRYERAQAIFKRYNLDFDETSWDVRPKPQVERVLKAPRMRVRWTCHECKTTFGHDRICVECAHQRCKTCARYPPKKKKAQAAKKAAVVATMTEPSKGEVRDGACHECQTAFKIGSQECSNCHHMICERCLQETLSAEQYQSPVVVTT